MPSPPGDLTPFTGRAPYASELFGVCQPLIGWRSARTKRRIDEDTVKNLEAMVELMLSDGELTRQLSAGISLVDLIEADVPRSPWWTDPTPDPSSATALVTQYIVDNRADLLKEQPWSDFRATLGRLAARSTVAAPGDQEVGGADFAGGGTTLSSSHGQDAVHEPSAGNKDPLSGLEPRGQFAGYSIFRTQHQLSDEECKRLQAVPIPGASRLYAVPSRTRDLRAERSKALGPRLMEYLFEKHPNALVAAFTVGPPSYWRGMQSYLSPLSSFDKTAQEAFLSPVAVIEVFRKYFYELDEFEGPSVEHVWVSPGGTVELYEVRRRRSRTEHTTAHSIQTTSRLERAIVEQDELSSAVTEQNQTNTSFGISAEAGFNFAVAQGSASAEFNLATNRTKAEQSTRRHAREQTDRISQELTRNFQSTFRDEREQEDVSSRRHVLANPGSEVANYSLKRKMRRVAVQLFKEETQLCWQVFLDEPGASLGVAELVHIARPADMNLPPPPEAPPHLEPKTTELTANFPYYPTVGDAPDARFLIQPDGSGADGSGNSIVATRRFIAPPPGIGYRLRSVVENAVVGTDPGKWQPEIAPAYGVLDDESFEIQLQSVRFFRNPALRFSLTLSWDPPDQPNAANEYATLMSGWEEQKRREEHRQFVLAAQERVEQSAAIKPRPATELREEERAVVFRRLIAQLTESPRRESDHTVSELIRSIFDIDRMLYFVAPEWWRARQLGSGGVLRGSVPLEGPVVTQLTEDDVVGWGGAGERDRPNYPITSESEPARMGASLGWILQLDGDNHRNAFLNSPWVKAVLPIQAGKEGQALEWLERSSVEGVDGLDATYAPNGVPPNPDPTQQKTVRQALLELAGAIAAANTSAALAKTVVTESGFNPLPGGFRATREDPDETAFDQWVEIVPTDQVVAVPYRPGDGRQPGIFRRIFDWLVGS